MKTALLLLIVSATICHKVHSASFEVPSAGSDSVPKQRTAAVFRPQNPPGFSSIAEQAFRLQTFTVRSGNTQSGNKPGEIVIPAQGMVHKIVAVRTGNVILQDGRDFTYRSAENRLLILNQSALQSGQPIEITYESAWFPAKR